MVKYASKKGYSKGKRGSAKGKKNYRSSKLSSGTVSAVKRLVKAVALKKSEPKNTAYHWGKTELYHNSGSPASGQILPTPIEALHYSLMPPQGNGDHQRNGDQIYAKGTSVKMLLGHKADRMNITFRIVAWKGTTDAKPISYNELFDHVSSNVLLDCTNSDRGKIIYNKYIKKVISSQLSTTKEFTFVHKFWIPYKKLIKYVYNNATDFSGEKIYIYVFAYDAYGSLLTDNVAYVQTWLKFYYRDP